MNIIAKWGLAGRVLGVTVAFMLPSLAQASDPEPGPRARTSPRTASSARRPAVSPARSANAYCGARASGGALADTAAQASEEAQRQGEAGGNACRSGGPGPWQDATRRAETPLEPFGHARHSRRAGPRHAAPDAVSAGASAR